mmetsp:Transcript_13635/g.22496  ORF Transcript_13635/g.22496 Transcript_13635/m.22496 type:complete len:88 (+) Transcript_13635:948-1211(+)
MAGIAAEALAYGQAEGGSSDELALQLLISQIRPVWRPEKLQNQALWSVLRATEILKEYRSAHDILVKSMSDGRPLSECLSALDSALS